jgi:hypothetical protein
MTGVKTVKATFLLPCDFLEMEDTRELSEREVKIKETISQEYLKVFCKNSS